MTTPIVSAPAELPFFAQFLVAEPECIDGMAGLSTMTRPKGGGKDYDRDR